MSSENYYEQHILLNSTHFIWDGDQFEYTDDEFCGKQVIKSNAQNFIEKLLYISDNQIIKSNWITTEHIEAILNLRYWV